MTSEYLTMKDIQDKLHISRNTAYKLVKLKGFPAVKLGGKYLVEDSALTKYMQDHQGVEIFL